MLVGLGHFHTLRPGLRFPLAGGGAYYFAKRSVNAERKARHEAELKRRRLSESLEFSSRQPTNNDSYRRTDGHAGIPSSEVSLDPAPTMHAPEKDVKKPRERSKYEASEPFRARKGDRFS